MRVARSPAHHVAAGEVDAHADGDALLGHNGVVSSRLLEFAWHVPHTQHTHSN